MLKLAVRPGFFVLYTWRPIITMVWRARTESHHGYFGENLSQIGRYLASNDVLSDAITLRLEKGSMSSCLLITTEAEERQKKKTWQLV